MKRSPEGAPQPTPPFDATKELTTIRTLTEEEQALDPKERRGVRREHLEDFKEKLILQKEGVALGIQRIREEINHHPSARIQDLQELAVDLAPRFGINADQLKTFESGIVAYKEKHRAVEKYRSKYPSDRRLFEICFGKPPKGEVEVIKGPMILYFRCHDEDDYATAYYLGDTTTIPQESSDRTKSSGGTALGNSLIKELEGTLAIENASIIKHSPDYVKTEPIQDTVKTVKTIPIDQLTIRRGLSVELPQGAVFNLQIINVDEKGRPVRALLEKKASWRDKNGEPLYRLLSIHDKDSIRYVAETPSHEKPKSVRDMMVPLMEGTTNYGTIMLRGNQLVITHEGAQDNDIYLRYDKRILVNGAKQQSAKIFAHEEQHQFNKLFIPVRRQTAIEEARHEIRATHDPKKAKADLLRALIRIELEKLPILDRARDEFLAYYRDGSSPTRIYDTLASSPLYNYAEQYKKSIDQVIHDTAGFQRHVDEVFKDKSTIKPLRVSPEEIANHVKEILGDEYRTHLKQWAEAMDMLRGKHYSRDQILSLLYAEPAEQWNAVARRMPNTTMVR